MGMRREKGAWVCLLPRLCPESGCVRGAGAHSAWKQGWGALVCVRGGVGPRCVTARVTRAGARVAGCGPQGGLGWALWRRGRGGLGRRGLRVASLSPPPSLPRFASLSPASRARLSCPAGGEPLELLGRSWAIRRGLWFSRGQGVWCKAVRSGANARSPLGSR